MANSGPTDATPSAKQLVFLAMMATVVAVIVFLCGVLVGRGVPVRRAGGALDRAPGETTAVGLTPDDREGAGDEGSPLDDLTYYDRLNDDPPPPVPPARVSGDGRPPDAAAAAPVATTPPTDPAPEPAPPPAPASTGYMVQVAALLNRDEAGAVADRLARGGYPVRVLDPPSGGTDRLFRVRVGPYPARADAERASRRLQTEEAFTTWVVEP